MTERLGSPPLLLLDDVFSELDPDRAHAAASPTSRPARWSITTAGAAAARHVAPARTGGRPRRADRRWLTTDCTRSSDSLDAVVRALRRAAGGEGHGGRCSAGGRRSSAPTSPPTPARCCSTTGASWSRSTTRLGDPAALPRGRPRGAAGGRGRRRRRCARSRCACAAADRALGASSFAAPLWYTQDIVILRL